MNRVIEQKNPYLNVLVGKVGTGPLRLLKDKSLK